MHRVYTSANLQILIFSPQVSDMNNKHPITFENFPKFSEHFRRFPTIFENFQEVREDRFENFPTIPEDLRQFPKILKSSKCWKVVLSTLRRFSIFSEDFRRFPKIFKNFENLLECLFLHSPVLFPKFPTNFQTFNKGDMNPSSGN